MTACTNPDCPCREVEEQKPYTRLSASTVEVKYRMALSRLQLAYGEVHELFTGEYFGDEDAMGSVLRNLEEMITDLKEERRVAAAKFGFVVKDGVGPGDWRHT